MRNVVMGVIIVSFMLALCSCGDDGMSYEEYEKFSSMEEELNQYHALDDYKILTEDDEAGAYKEISDKYGEDIAEDVFDIIYSNTHQLYQNIN